MDRGAPGGVAPQAGLAGRRADPTLRAFIAVPLILGLVTLCVFMAINSSDTQGWRRGPGMTRIMSCQSAQEPAGHS